MPDINDKAPAPKAEEPSIWSTISAELSAAKDCVKDMVTHPSDTAKGMLTAGLVITNPVMAGAMVGKGLVEAASHKDAIEEAKTIAESAALGAAGGFVLGGFLGAAEGAVIGGTTAAIIGHKRIEQAEKAAGDFLYKVGKAAVEGGVMMTLTPALGPMITNPALHKWLDSFHSSDAGTGGKK